MQKDKKSFFVKYSSVSVILFIFIIYLMTIAPSVVQIDSGELAAVQATLGIAHPTGYPLFTMIGYLLLKIPLPFTKIFQANLLASVWCVLGILFFIKSSMMIFNNLENIKEKVKGKKSKNELHPEKSIDNDSKTLLTVASIIFGSFNLAFSETFWSQSTSVEVYSLQIFLFNLIIFTILRAYYSKEGKLKDWLYAAIALALGFSNHMTTLLVLPFIAILFFHKEKFRIESFKKIVIMLVLFFAILAGFYSYLPLRASAGPLINWGNPVNLENIFRHVSGKQYQVWLFASFEAAGKQLKYFLSDFPSEFAYTGMIIGFIGLVALFKKSKILFSTISATFLFAVLYSINYDIVDIDSYFLLAYIMFSFFTVFGFYRILIFLIEKWNLKISLTFGLLISLVPLVINFGRVDQSNVYTFEDYTKAILGSVEKNSIVFSYQWDFFVAASYYFQDVENYRKDVIVIDKELLRRSWYYNQLKTRHPNLFANMNNDVSNFLDAVKPFERSESFDSNLIESYYREVMKKLISTNIGKRNYYISQELVQNEMQRGEFSLPDGYQIVPDILLLKVVKGNAYVPARDPDFRIRFPKTDNKYIESIRSFVYNMLIYRIYYELQFNKPERAKIYVEKIRKDFPERIIPPEILDKLK